MSQPAGTLLRRHKLKEDHMGYCTYFELTTYDLPDEEAFDQAFELATEYTRKCIRDEAVKWYDYRRDMLNLSKQFPDSTFELVGVGAEPGDHWAERYKNGKFSRVEAQLPPFPELKEPDQ